MNERVVPILGGIRWEPNAPNESFAHDDDGFAALVLRAHPDDPDRSSVVISWSDVEAASFGPPNDEGRHDHPLYGAGLDTLLWAGEVLRDNDEGHAVRRFIVPTKEGLADVRAGEMSSARLAGVTDARVAIHCLKPARQPEPAYPQSTVDGFTIGMSVSYHDCGDAWVQSPDGGIATLIWETGTPEYFRESIPPDPDGRWGTYAVQLNLPLTNADEAEVYLRALLPELIPRWRAWARRHGHGALKMSPGIDTVDQPPHRPAPCHGASND